ncbi:hypothetical protein FRD01_06295 [Microvenator marinus]|uniref:Uncharacterized protein n=1 Tax=Microvenator marinus TaxID=2600177 RepID=A0A5B8XT82_9DELT|nr:hypothetical protein FRD01_06295 [Microvenator marinus]
MGRGVNFHRLHRFFRFNLGLFNLGLFNLGLFNHGLFNFRDFNHGLFNGFLNKSRENRDGDAFRF